MMIETLLITRSEGVFWWCLIELPALPPVVLNSSRPCLTRKTRLRTENALFSS